MAQFYKELKDLRISKDISLEDLESKTKINIKRSQITDRKPKIPNQRSQTKDPKPKIPNQTSRTKD